jgi:hypothetical protein
MDRQTNSFGTYIMKRLFICISIVTAIVVFALIQFSDFEVQNLDIEEMEVSSDLAVSTDGTVDSFTIRDSNIQLGNADRIEIRSKSRFPLPEQSNSNDSVLDAQLYLTEIGNKYAAIIGPEAYNKLLDEIGVDTITKENILAEIEEATLLSYEMNRGRWDSVNGGNHRIDDADFISRQMSLSPSAIMQRYLNQEQLKKFSEIESARLPTWSEILSEIQVDLAKLKELELLRN